MAGPGQTELELASWVLSALSIPAGDERYADTLLRSLSWHDFSSRAAGLLWKTMGEMRAEGKPVVPDTVARRLGRDLPETGCDLAGLWDLIRIERLPSRQLVVELIVPSLKFRFHTRGRYAVVDPDV